MWYSGEVQESASGWLRFDCVTDRRDGVSVDPIEHAACSWCGKRGSATSNGAVHRDATAKAVVAQVQCVFGAASVSRRFQGGGHRCFTFLVDE